MGYDGVDKYMTSDQIPICGYLPNPEYSSGAMPRSCGKLRVLMAEIHQFSWLVAQQLPPLISLNTLEEIENFARNID